VCETLAQGKMLDKKSGGQKSDETPFTVIDELVMQQSAFN
jgi:hypothetical protein